jgi:hypothetical protein
MTHAGPDVLRTLVAVGRVAGTCRRAMAAAEEPELADDAFAAVDLVLDSVRQTTGRRRATNLLSAWAGLVWFCDDCVGVDALTLAKSVAAAGRGPGGRGAAAVPGRRGGRGEGTRRSPSGREKARA